MKLLGKVLLTHNKPKKQEFGTEKRDAGKMFTFTEVRAVTLLSQSVQTASPHLILILKNLPNFARNSRARPISSVSLRSSPRERRTSPRK